MVRTTFETPDGDELEVDSDDVIELRAGEEEGTTVIELEDGEEVTVVATQLEVVAELGLSPLDYILPENDDESIEDLVDEEAEEEEE